MTVAPAKFEQAPAPRSPVSTASTFEARPEPDDSEKFVVAMLTLVPAFRYAAPPFTVRSPPVGAVVSACAVNVRPGPVRPAPFVAVMSPLCVVDEASKLYRPLTPVSGGLVYAATPESASVAPLALTVKPPVAPPLK